MKINSTINWNALDLSSEVSELCAPINRCFDVTYFNYVRLNSDNTRYLLTNNPDWIKFFYKNKYYNYPTTLEIETLKYKEYITWKQLKDEFTFQQALNFNIANGLTIVESSEKYVDLYYFGTNTENISASDIYESNIDAFKRFILYFKDKGAKILDRCHHMPIEFQDYTTNKINRNLYTLEQFINTIIHSNNFRFIYNSKKTPKVLSKQETICASYLILQFSMREIAQKIGISHRTVETYINSIKNKLGCLSKNKLVQELLKLKILNINEANIDNINHESFYSYDINNLILLNDFIEETKLKRIYIENLNKISYLTQKECEVIYYICNGLSAKIISLKINCSIKTTESYIYALKKKFFVRKKSDLVAMCVCSGLLHKIILSFPYFQQI